MPELPEVEIVCRGLHGLVKPPARIASIEIIRGDLRKPIPRAKMQKLVGERVMGFRRRAKYLLMDTESYTIINHLGMTGSWRAVAAGESMPHDHVFMSFSGGLRLAFNDPRRFGLLTVVAKGQAESSLWLKRLGPEPLDDDRFSGDYLFKISRHRQPAIKTFIMDQNVVVGVGNIYASEALYRAGIRPTRSAQRLTRDQAELLVGAIRDVLGRAITAGGSTIRDYRQAGGEPGRFQAQFDVYGREGENCRSCQKPIRSQIVSGRSSYWCPGCQL